MTTQQQQAFVAYNDDGYIFTGESWEDLNHNEPKLMSADDAEELAGERGFTLPAESVLKIGDVIEIVQNDDKGKKSIRRVKVAWVCTSSLRHIINGVNMQGENSIRYRLSHTPFIPGQAIPKTPNLVGWFRFSE